MYWIFLWIVLSRHGYFVLMCRQNVAALVAGHTMDETIEEETDRLLERFAALLCVVCVTVCRYMLLYIMQILFYMY